MNNCTDCNEIEIPIGETGPQGIPGTNASMIVKDGGLGIVTGCTEIRFTDADAVVTDLGNGIAEVRLIPTATVWTDIQNIPYYVAGSESIKPQFTLEGNKISFRGMLYVPLDNGSGVTYDINGANAYLLTASAVLGEASLKVISNANPVSGTPQGRFFTSNVANKNLPTNAIPVIRDIVFTDVPAYRRYSGGKVAIYRTFVDIRIGALTTVFTDAASAIGSGCIMMFSPYNKQYNGVGLAPLGNDPLALGISNVVNATTAAGYVASVDDNPFTIGAGLGANEFSVNAHSISNLGGFIINLEGLTGYIN